MESINGQKSATSFKTQTTHLTVHLTGVRHLTHLNISNLTHLRPNPSQILNISNSFSFSSQYFKPTSLSPRRHGAKHKQKKPTSFSPRRHGEDIYDLIKLLTQLLAQFLAHHTGRLISYGLREMVL